MPTASHPVLQVHGSPGALRATGKGPEPSSRLPSQRGPIIWNPTPGPVSWLTLLSASQPQLSTVHMMLLLRFLLPTACLPTKARIFTLIPRPHPSSPGPGPQQARTECASPLYSASVQSVLEKGGSGAAGLLIPPQAWGLALPASPQPHCEHHSRPGLPSWTRLTAQGPSLPPGRDDLAHGGLGTHGHPPGAGHTVESSDWCWGMTQPPKGHTRPRPVDPLDDVRTKRSERWALPGPPSFTGAT